MEGRRQRVCRDHPLFLLQVEYGLQVILFADGYFHIQIV
jgi:hypothetical protein